MCPNIMWTTLATTPTSHIRSDGGQPSILVISVDFDDWFYTVSYFTFQDGHFLTVAGPRGPPGPLGPKGEQVSIAKTSRA